MLSVLESITLRPEFANATAAKQIAQEYEGLLDSNAHAADGYVDHAAFFYAAPNQLLVLYPWRDRPSAEALLRSEDVLISNWSAKYCDAQRQITLLDELAVKV